MIPLSALLLLGSVHGTGIYSEGGGDLAWSDRVGLLARGERLSAEAGLFTGDFQGSYGFGDFWRFGMGFSWEPIVLRGARTSAREKDSFLVQFYTPHLTLAHGANLFKLGFMWKMRLGPTWSTNRSDVFLDGDVIWGGSFIVEGSVYYNIFPTLSVGPRVGAGVLVDELRVGFQGTMGVAFSYAIPFKRVRPETKADYWEKNY